MRKRWLGLMSVEQFQRPKRTSSAVSPCRVFAVEIRSQRVGYAVVERRKNLLDWGVRTFPNPESPDSHRKLAAIFTSLHPTVIILSGLSEIDHRDVGRVGAIIRLFREQADAFSISTQTFPKSSIRSHFVNAGHLSKHEIARVIVDTFPELAWQLPRKRKAWQSESSSQLIFDAITLLIFYFARNQND